MKYRNPFTMRVAGARMGRILLGSLAGLVGVGLVAAGAYWFFTSHVANAQPRGDQAEVAKAEGVRRINADTIVIPGDVSSSIGLVIAEVKKATRPRTMPLSGNLNLDSDRIPRVHARFAGEIVALGTNQGEETSETKAQASSPGRPLRFGDRVHKDQLLAVLWSKDLGEKKSEWIDAQSKLNLDRGILKDLQELNEKGAMSERSVREAQRNVDSDMIALKRAEHTLLSWGLKEKEFAELRAEALKPDRKTKEQQTDYERWARVEIRSPQDGTIFERNFTLHDLVDTTTDLFKIADTSKLVVWANLYEEDLPTLQKLPLPIKWTIRLPSQPGVTYPGQLDQVGEIIDSNQHTALVKGMVDNPRGDLRVGQFVTATIDIPPAANELEIPSTALVEDGHDSIVFAQVPDEQHQFQRRKVTVTRRYKDVVYVRADSESKDGIHAGDHVIAGGAVLLNEAVGDLPIEAPK
jgi:membrane fusion protein, heavy metal efflux system